MKLMLFKNKYKDKESQPDWNVHDRESEGFEKIGGGWNNHTDKAGDYISITIDREKAEQYSKVETTEGDGGDDIPF